MKRKRPRVKRKIVAALKIKQLKAVTGGHCGSGGGSNSTGTGSDTRCCHGW
jgi:hypothetical protein